MSDQVDRLREDAERPLSIPGELPVLPLRDTVLFPNSFMPLAVARESSVRVIEEAIADHGGPKSHDYELLGAAS